jgi:hypothetical protein
MLQRMSGTTCGSHKSVMSENVKKQLLLDFDYWADHLVEAQERFDDFLQQ